MFRKAVFRRSAFTLIELLIVVAIIAILAAIAVPNFLEAQVRSKVSRAKADMRSVATAIESYAVDYQMYPVPLNGVLIADAHSLQNVVELTTPVAYITVLPKDPFPTARGRGVVETGVVNDGAPYPIEYNYIYQNLKVINTPSGFSNSFGAQVASLDASAPTWEGYDRMSYILISMGPSLLNNGLTWFVMGQPGAELGTVYDPTNGTKSWGDIGRVGGNARSKAVSLVNK